MVSGKDCEDKLRSIRRFNIGDIVPGGAGPSGFRPKPGAFNALERNPGKAMALVVGIFARTREVSLQEFHHSSASLGRHCAARNDLREQPRCSIGSEFVSVLPVGPAGNPLPTI